MWTTERKVRNYVEKHHLIQEGDVLVAGISGGADSVCLFYLLIELQAVWKFRLIAVHLNHMLRGEEAVRDQKFVEEMCRKEGIPFRAFEKDVAHLAAEEGLSPEEAGRKARYDAFAQVMREECGTKIVLAHHRDDQAETLIHHMARGTGITGLCGLRPMSGDRIRPLLCLERKEIEKYLTERGISWQTDSTNLNDDYTRNKIRHHVVRYLCEEINPSATAHMAETAEELQETELLLEQLTEACMCQCTTEADGKMIFQENFWGEPDLIQRRAILQGMKKVAGFARDFTRTHAEDVRKLREKPVGKKIMLPYGVEAVRDYEGMIIRKTEGKTQHCLHSSLVLEVGEEVKEWNLGEYTIYCCVIPYNFGTIEEKTYTKWLDYDKIKNSVEIRHRRSGDRISILPSGGSKKLKDYLIDRKIPREKRDALWLAADGSEILWVIGDRISEAYKVTDKTRKILHIQIKGGNIHE